MALEAKLYGQGKRETYLGNIDWENDTIKCALMAITFNPNQDTDATWDDVSSHESSGTNYAPGGATLTGRAVTYNGATNEVRLAADDVEWPDSTIDAEYAVVYKDTGTPGTSPLISYVTFDGEKSSADGMFAIRWDGGLVATTTLD